MKKFLFGIVIAAVVAIVFGSTSLVSAQSGNPPTTVPAGGYGQDRRGGMMGGQGARAGMMNNPNAAGDQDGLLHDEMIAVYAQKLGIAAEDLNVRLANGETMAQIAASKGLTAAQFTTLMSEARSQAIDQALKAGTLTQAQADWMKQRGAGMAAGGRGMRGNAQNRNANPDCPYTGQAQ